MSQTLLMKISSTITMVQVHLFDRIIKQDCDTDALWNVIDTKKLKDGLL
jgi:hypothetical protein